MNHGVKLLVGSGMTLAALQADSMSRGNSRPNVLVIISDDQGIGDIGYNNPLVNTPVIDRLADESALFTGFIAAPACAPSRAAFLTGRNHFHTGVWGVGPRAFVNRDEVYLPEYLRRAGYRTAHFGKWEGVLPGMRAYLHGYEEAGCLGGGYQHQNPDMDFNGELKTMSGWTVDILTDLTIDFIRRQTAARQPWFAVTAYIAPHAPWVCDPAFSEPLEAKGYSKPLAALYGMIEQMDGAAGRILDTIDRLGQKEKTVVIFVSDNGATHACPLTGGTPMDGPDWAKRNPFHLRGRKTSLWENGIRVPFMIRWPEKIQAGERHQLGAIEDILPTVLDLTGVPASIVPEHLPLHGRSLRPVLANAEAPDEDRGYFRLPIAPPGMPLPQEQDHIGIINDSAELDYGIVHAVLYGPQFKFHHLPGGKTELYDIKTDVAETTDLSAKYPEKTADLAAACRAEWEQLVHSPRRSFTMPYFLIGDPRYEDVQPGWRRTLPPDVVPGDAPLAVTGTVRSPYGFNGAGGFVAPGDSAAYGVNVVAPGEYRIIVSGRDLTRCAPLSLMTGGRTYSSRSLTAEQMDFGIISFSSGSHELLFAVSGEKPDAGQGLIATVRFEKQE
jgi:arylsulfatase A-like enzyme